MSTFLDVITDAFVEINLYGPGDTLAPEDAELGQRCLNRMLASWSAERLTVYERRSDQIAVTKNVTSGFCIGTVQLPAGAVTPLAGASVITIANNAQAGQKVTISGGTGNWTPINGTFPLTTAGPSQVSIALNCSAFGPSPALTLVFSIPRPVAIESANFVVANGTSFPLHLLSSRDWSGKPSRATLDLVAVDLYCDFQHPLANVFAWPAPSIDNTLVELFTWRQLTQCLNLTDNFDFPPGYEAAIMTNLAVDLAGPTHAPITQTTIARAGQYKGVIQAINPPPYNGAMEEAIISQPPQQAQPQPSPQR